MILPRVDGITPPPAEWFFEMYQAHIRETASDGGSDLYHVLASYDIGTDLEHPLSFKEWFENQDLRHSLISTNPSSTYFEPATGFAGKELRQNEIEMIRDVDPAHLSMLGVPKGILPALADKYFHEVHGYVYESKGQDLTPETSHQHYCISVSLAFLLDFFHFKPDGNGRTSEEFMVQLQRRLFDGDMSKVRTWSQNGFRGYGSDRVIKPEYLLAERQTQTALRYRETAAEMVRSKILEVVSFQIDAANNGITDQDLIRNQAKIQVYFEQLISKIVHSPEQFLKQEFHDLKFDLLAGALFKATPPNPDGSYYNYQALDYYQTHTQAVEVLGRLQDLVQLSKQTFDRIKKY